LARRSRHWERARLNAAEIDGFVRDGFVVVRGLLPQPLVAATRERLFEVLEIDEARPESWVGKAYVGDPAALAVTAACRTEALEAAAVQLVGPHFLRRRAFSPFLEARGLEDPYIDGYIPVLNFPTPGPREFVRPKGYHIDGMRFTTLWPVWHYLVVFAYLTDTAEYGGATAVIPGSHRQVFEHWLRTAHPGSTVPPELDYADPVPFVGAAGDVLFMHYLAVHSSTANRSDHIRVGLNTVVLPDPAAPYQRKEGAPGDGWTPLDYTLRTDTL
jgi:hypothetical protein